MDELEDMLMEHGIMKPVDESLVGKTAAELAAAVRRRLPTDPAPSQCEGRGFNKTDQARYRS
jgi:hypothetical protein